MGIATCDNDITHTRQDYRLDSISFEVRLDRIFHCIRVFPMYFFVYTKKRIPGDFTRAKWSFHL